MPLILEGNPKNSDVAAEASIKEHLRLVEENVVMEETYKEGIVVSGNSMIIKQSKANLSSQLDKEDENELEKRGKFPVGPGSRYLNIEPSLAMDWLEISWDELHVKERVGAGTFSSLLAIVTLLKHTDLFFFEKAMIRKFMVFFFPSRFIWDSASSRMAWIGKFFVLYDSISHIIPVKDQLIYHSIKGWKYHAAMSLFYTN